MLGTSAAVASCACTEEHAWGSSLSYCGGTHAPYISTCIFVEARTCTSPHAHARPCPRPRLHLQLCVRDVARHHQRARQAQPRLDGALRQLLPDLGHGLVQADLQRGGWRGAGGHVGTRWRGNERGQSHPRGASHLRPASCAVSCGPGKCRMHTSSLTSHNPLCQPHAAPRPTHGPPRDPPQTPHRTLTTSLLSLSSVTSGRYFPGCRSSSSRNRPSLVILPRAWRSARMRHTLGRLGGGACTFEVHACGQRWRSCLRHRYQQSSTGSAHLRPHIQAQRSQCHALPAPKPSTQRDTR